MSTVSVIVVSYNTREHLRACLGSLPSSVQTIVVDNASHDGSAKLVASEFPDVTLIRNELNRGFGRANNQGMEIATGDLILLLNSDAKCTLGAVERLAEEFESPEVVAAGGCLVYPDGRRQRSAAGNLTLWAVFCEQTYLERLFAKTSPYWIEPGKSDASQDVEQVMGACLMFRPVERFDERFFLYCEDTELCHRLRRHGRIRYVRSAIFEHALGASSSENRWMSVARYNRGKELYFRIHHGRHQAVICWLLNRFGALLRAPIKPMFWRVLFSPLKGPLEP
ncbi:MAG TPA: glycosyltransferase family 2 protein [Fimbriimonadaceae bacterium]|nr:glycosyltransferase family 2 protein [Fimbriimonadaceae bacterium]